MQLFPLLREHDRPLQESGFDVRPHSRSIGSFSSVSVAERFPNCQNGRVDFTYALAPGMFCSISVPPSVEVRKNILKQNDMVVRVLRGEFRKSNVFVVSLVSSPGSGKTTFLESFDPAPPELPRCRTRWRSGDRERCSTTSPKRSAGQADHYRHAVSSGSRHGTKCAADIGYQPAGFSLY